jgi:hypothetical protein
MTILKPYQREGHVYLTRQQKSKLRIKFFNEQRGICGCGCGRPMTLELGNFATASLEHTKPQPMGHKKNDSVENLHSVWRWDCNGEKGSRRLSIPLDMANE